MANQTSLENPYSIQEIIDGHAVKSPEDYQDPKKLYDKLIRRVRKYHPSDDISMIERAFDIAYHAHEGQCRKSGEPYIIHPLWVGIILADLELDKETIVAGILHDVIEDTDMTLEQLREMGFPNEVLEALEYLTHSEGVEYFDYYLLHCLNVNNVRISRCMFYVSNLLKEIVDNKGKYKAEMSDRVPFTITPEQVKNFEFSDYPISISEITKRFNALINTLLVKELKNGVITDWLTQSGILTEITVNNRTRSAKLVDYINEINEIERPNWIEEAEKAMNDYENANQKEVNYNALSYLTNFISRNLIK